MEEADGFLKEIVFSTLDRQSDEVPIGADPMEITLDLLGDVEELQRADAQLISLFVADWQNQR